MIKTLAAAAVMAGAVIAAPVQAAPLGAAGHSFQFSQGAGDLVETVQYRRYGYGPRHGYGARYGYRGGGRGAAIGAGIAAGAIGALAAGAIASQARPVYAEPVYPAYPVYGAPAPVYAPSDVDAVAYCSRRFRSYDPETGTYIANGGVVRACP